MKTAYRVITSYETECEGEIRLRATVRGSRGQDVVVYPSRGSQNHQFYELVKIAATNMLRKEAGLDPIIRNGLISKADMEALSKTEIYLDDRPLERYFSINRDPSKQHEDSEFIAFTLLRFVSI